MVFFIWYGIRYRTRRGRRRHSRRKKVSGGHFFSPGKSPWSSGRSRYGCGQSSIRYPPPGENANRVPYRPSKSEPHPIGWGFLVDYCFLLSKWPEWITGGFGSLASQGIGCFSSRFMLLPSVSVGMICEFWGNMHGEKRSPARTRAGERNQLRASTLNVTMSPVFSFLTMVAVPTLIREWYLSFLGSLFL